MTARDRIDQLLVELLPALGAHGIAIPVQPDDAVLARDLLDAADTLFQGKALWLSLAATWSARALESWAKADVAQADRWCSRAAAECSRAINRAGVN